MDTRCVFVFYLIALCASLNLADASLCKANSKFKIDCNTCQCSSNGREYSCSNFKCPLIGVPLVNGDTLKDYKAKYDVTETKDGHKLLVPKSSDEFNFEDDDDLPLPRQRIPRVPDGYPYINDEMYVPEHSKKNKRDFDLFNNVPPVDEKIMYEDGKLLDSVEIDKRNTSDNDDDEDDEETNDISREQRWKPFLPRKNPVYPE